jgi:hypothetical protein
LLHEWSDWNQATSAPFFRGMEVWIQGFMLVKQTFNCLSHTTSPFSSGYFGDDVLFFAQAGLEPQFSKS